MKTAKTFLVIVALLVTSGAAFAKKNKKTPGVLVKSKDVPAAVQTTLQTNASGGKVKEVEKQAVNGQTIYCAEVKGTDGKWSKIYVKEAGDLLKVEPDNARNKRKHKPLFGD
jgi:Holliday junction resolvase